MPLDVFRIGSSWPNGQCSGEFAQVWPRLLRPYAGEAVAPLGPISPLQIKQLTRSGTQACHPRASPVHSLVTGKARVVLRDLVAQGAENPQLVVLQRFLPAAYRAATRRNPPLPRAALGTRWSGLVECIRTFRYL